MRLVFERGRAFAIAAHDEKLIEETIRLSNVHHPDFEFEMLGISYVPEERLESFSTG